VQRLLKMSHADLAERAMGALVDLGPRLFDDLPRREGQVLSHRHVRPQGVALEDRADPLTR
jgi:hypothetical protein